MIKHVTENRLLHIFIVGDILFLSDYETYFSVILEIIIYTAKNLNHLLHSHSKAFIENDYLKILWSILTGQTRDILYKRVTCRFLIVDF